MAYGRFDRSYHPKNYLIIRIGAHTTDFTMISIEDGIAEILDSMHLNKFGGHLFTERIVNYYINQ
jgi:molecular chaperone DnaK (HSP70)